MYSRNDIERDYPKEGHVKKYNGFKQKKPQMQLNDRNKHQGQNPRKHMDRVNKNDSNRINKKREDDTSRLLLKSNKHDDISNVNVETKKMVLDYIYSKLELAQYKYVLLEYELDLPRLKEKTYLISPNYNGINSLMVYIKIKDKFLSFIIDRKTLMYNMKDLDYAKVKMYPIKFRADKEIYNGTIFDGVTLHHNGKRHFILNDIYYFRGDDLTMEKLQTKMVNITAYIDAHKTQDNNVVITPNIFKKLMEIQNLMEKEIPSSEMCRYIKGISFYPEYSGTKLIYLYNRQNDKPVLSSNTQWNEQSHTLNVPVNEELITAVFKVNKTQIVDVYNLYLGEISVENNVKLFKTKNVGIAYIPTKDCSFFCKEIFDSVDTTFMSCSYDKSKKLWIPMKVVDDCKRPDLIVDVDKKIQ